MAEANPKIAWKRAELAVNRFRKTAETDVARLNQFKKNIFEVCILHLKLNSSYYVCTHHRT